MIKSNRAYLLVVNSKRIPRHPVFFSRSGTTPFLIFDPACEEVERARMQGCRATEARNRCLAEPGEASLDG